MTPDALTPAAVMTPSESVTVYCALVAALKLADPLQLHAVELGTTFHDCAVINNDAPRKQKRLATRMIM